MRCAEHGKVVFIEETKAQLACVKAAMEDGRSLSWYYSKECRHWHVTSSGERYNTGKRVGWVKGFHGETVADEDETPSAA